MLKRILWFILGFALPFIIFLLLLFFVNNQLIYEYKILSFIVHCLPVAVCLFFGFILRREKALVFGLIIGVLSAYLFVFLIVPKIFKNATKSIGDSYREEARK